MSKSRGRRAVEPELYPVDHDHSWKRVRMDLIPVTEITRDGSVRAERMYSCPSCGYELFESKPIRSLPARAR